ncbi:hypothetical protein [Streptomyces sp. WAC05374]|uniref:hypothetical protein n=1 Tax=Streptomyces sp. WAC05374 TaxID=2487420 RepID=UPI00163BCE19|nr:hypothetical protein [Streptomyces sp. WAC05374]
MTSGASAAHSASDSAIMGASRPRAASRMNARERVWRRGGVSSGTSPRWKAAHQSSSRAVRDHQVRVTQCSVPDAETNCSRPRRKWPARTRLFSAVLTARWPYSGRTSASVL